MNKNARKSKIYLEDTIRRSSDNVIGVVTRTWHDIEQPEDAEELNPGDFEVNWLDDFGAYGDRRLAGKDDAVVHEDSDEYTLVDRSFGLGDAVKLDSSSPMSGIVQSGRTQLQIRNLATREIRDCQSDEVVVEAERFQVGDYIVCEKTQWVGIIKKLERRTLVKFYSGELAFCDEFEMIPEQYEEGNIFYPDLLPGTTIVQISKSGLRHAEYLKGKYTKSMSRTGVVCTSFTSRVVVNWQFQNMMVSIFVAQQPPPIDFTLNVDSKLDDTTLRTARALDGAFTHQVGDVVRLVGGEPYSRSFQEFVDVTFEDGKRNCKDWEVISTEQEILVKWQDGSVGTYRATQLVPYLNVDDLDLWPADNVISKSDGRSGIVQTCNAKDRTATVHWDGTQSAEEESLYDLMNNGAFNVDLGDLVLIVPADGQVSEQAGPQSWGPTAIINSISSTVTRYISTRATQEPTSGPSSKETTSMIDWFGQLVAIDEDGYCKVSLCFERQAMTIRVPVTRLVHVASTGNDDDGDESDVTTDSDLIVDSTDSESEAYSSDDSEMEDEDDEALWQDENGVEVPAEDGGEWEDDDVEMDHGASDVEVIDVVAEDILPPETDEILLDVTPTNDGEAFQALNTNREELGSIQSTSNPQNTSSEKNIQQNDATDSQKLDRSKEVAEAAKPVALQADFFPASDQDFSPFVILETEPTDHAFVGQPLNRRSQALKRIAHEYKSLANSLPPGILVRSFDSRIDLLRVVILGPPSTPYEYAPMLFDFYIPPEYPQEPPVVHFHSWTNGVGKINPNLYEEGKVCLSLLGTWHGNEMSETWNTHSSLLQIFVSLQALVLVKEPYYNEAGYDVLSAHDTAVASANYSERAFVLTRGFIAHALRNPIQGLENEIRWLYQGPPQFLKLAITQAQTIASQSQQHSTDAPASSSSETITTISKGALLLLQRMLKDLHSI